MIVFWYPTVSLNLYNTLAGDKQPFAPLLPGRVGLYVCGPTVYDDAHLGHARSAVFFDVVCRFFEALGWTTAYVRNYTDIDDKILERAAAEGVSIDTIAGRCIASYEADMRRLNVRPPDHAPRATEYIRPMQEMVGRLVQQGHAYLIQGRVYFRVDAFPSYGKLANRRPDKIPTLSRLEPDPDKSNPLDFLLWKPSEPDAPGWESPWGRGRPGWHIECSAMARILLGDQFDIHGGGADLIFPHHENEIAQSQAVTGEIPARFWIHHEMVIINGRKMAKSTGRCLTVRSLLETWHSEAIRLFLLSKHYRHPLDFSPRQMAACAASIERIHQMLFRAEKVIGPPVADEQATSGFWHSFCETLANDFNTPAAMAVLFRAVRLLNQGLNSAERGSLAAQDIASLRVARSEVLKMCREVLGIAVSFKQDGPAAPHSMSL